MAPVSRWLRFRLGADRVLACILAAMTAPIVAALAVLVRRHDGHPSLITVPRVGRGGKHFGMWKIRSMRVDSDDGRASGAALTSSNDQRVTPIGVWLRRLHLDELPQLYNVARGEMCLLGPRPEAPDYVDLNDRDWQEVLSLPPGIAGPTQLIVGDWERTEIDVDATGEAYREVVVPVKLAIDRWYVSESSPGLDLLVLTSLARHVLPLRESTRLQQRVGAAVAVAELPIRHLAAASHDA